MEVREQRDELGRRVTAAFVPYRRTPEGLECYLQYRDGNARVHARMFSMFGGGLDEGETPEAGFLRETKEELGYEPHTALFFCTYVTQRAVFHTYVEDVGGDFEQQVTVLEGECGKFLTEQEVRSMLDVSPIAKLIVEELAERLRSSMVR